MTIAARTMTKVACINGVALHPQDATLTPWSNVFCNVWLPLRLASASILASIGAGTAFVLMAAAKKNRVRLQR